MVQTPLSIVHIHSLITHFILLKGLWNQISSCDDFCCYDWIFHIPRPLGSTNKWQSSHTAAYEQGTWVISLWCVILFLSVLLTFPHKEQLVNQKSVPIANLCSPRSPEKKQKVVVLLFLFLLIPPHTGLLHHLTYPVEKGGTLFRS